MQKKKMQHTHTAYLARAFRKHVMYILWPYYKHACQHTGECYKYTSDLKQLSGFPNSSPIPLPAALHSITTPLNRDAWALWLNHHPDQEFAQWVLSGITNGFRIGFDHSTHTCRPAKRNHPSALERPTVVAQSLSKETTAKRLIGPIDPTHFPQAHTSSLGVIPKKHAENKWRLILDLSRPRGNSVNDGIPKPLCSLSYTSVESIVQKIVSNGQGTLLAKIDVESAFRNIPVHPQDRHLLGMLWEGGLYVDTVLPFGLRSAPKIFNAVADALEWIARERGVTQLDHYLDDFITMGAPHSMECSTNLNLLVNTCKVLNMPLSLSKLEGPTTQLVFLGIEIDTVAFQLKLPEQKLRRLFTTTRDWITKKCCKKRDLQSLIGQLHDASIIIRPGRTFLRRLLDLLKAAHKYPQEAILRLNLESRSDILWWYTFITSWNGLSIMRALNKSYPEITVTSDASGSWGCGAHWQNLWFQHPWDDTTRHHNITVKELIPIVISVAIWGESWANKTVLCRCDNEAVVSILTTGTSKEKDAMALLRCLFFFAAHFNIHLTSTHIAGATNSLADALSRNHSQKFFHSLPQANPSPTPVPQQLLDLLLHDPIDWASPKWSTKFSSTCSQLSQPLPQIAMPLQTDGTATSVHSQVCNHTQPQSASYANSQPI